MLMGETPTPTESTEGNIPPSDEINQKSHQDGVAESHSEACGDQSAQEEQSESDDSEFASENESDSDGEDSLTFEDLEQMDTKELLSMAEEELSEEQYEAAVCLLETAYKKELERYGGDVLHPALGWIHYLYADALLRKEEANAELVNESNPEVSAAMTAMMAEVLKSATLSDDKENGHASAEQVADTPTLEPGSAQPVSQSSYPTKEMTQPPQAEVEPSDEQIAWEELEYARLCFNNAFKQSPFKECLELVDLEKLKSLIDNVSAEKTEVTEAKTEAMEVETSISVGIINELVDSLVSDAALALNSYDGAASCSETSDVVVKSVLVSLRLADMLLNQERFESCAANLIEALHVSLMYKVYLKVDAVLFTLGQILQLLGSGELAANCLEVCKLYLGQNLSRTDIKELNSLIDGVTTSLEEIRSRANTVTSSSPKVAVGDSKRNAALKRVGIDSEASLKMFGRLAAKDIALEGATEAVSPALPVDQPVMDLGKIKRSRTE